MINLMKGYKNKVTASSFLKWYFSDSDDLKSLGSRALDSLLYEGVFNVDARTFFDECNYIPQHICEDADGNNEYDPSEVCFIQD